MTSYFRFDHFAVKCCMRFETTLCFSSSFLIDALLLIDPLFIFLSFPFLHTFFLILL
jgi:hypothetical protein